MINYKTNKKFIIIRIDLYYKLAFIIIYYSINMKTLSIFNAFLIFYQIINS